MLRKLFVVLAGVCLLGFVVAAPAHADYPPTNPDVILSNPTPAPGAPFTVGFGVGSFDAGEVVQITVNGEHSFSASLAVIGLKRAFGVSKDVGTAQADDAGAVEASVKIDTPGRYTVTGTGVDSGRTHTSAVITVGSGGGGGDNPSGPTHPQTGGFNSIPLIGGLVLVALGGTVLFLTRRRSAR